MTPPTNSSRRDGDRPYRSRLLSFLRRQTLRWRDRYQVTARQARSAGVWGVQLLLYPAYWLFRGDRQALKADAGDTSARSLAATEMEPAMMESIAIVATGLADTLAPATKIDAIAADLVSHQPVAIAADGQVIELPKTLQQEVQAVLADLQPKRSWLARFVSWMQSGPLVRSRSSAGTALAVRAPSLKPIPKSTTASGSLMKLWTPPTPQEPFSLQVLIQSAIAYFFGPRATHGLIATDGDERPQHSELTAATELDKLGPTQTEPSLALESVAEMVPWLAFEDLFPVGLLPEATGDRAAAPKGNEDAHNGTAPPEGLELGGTDLFVSALPFVPEEELEEKPEKTGRDASNVSDGASDGHGAAATSATSATAFIKVSRTGAIAAPKSPPHAENAELAIALDNLSDLSSVESAGELSDNPTDDPSQYLNVRVVASRYVKNPLEVIIDGLDRLLSWLEDWVFGAWRRLWGWVTGLFGGN